MFRVGSEYVQSRFRVCSGYVQSLLVVKIVVIALSSASSVSVFGIFFKEVVLKAKVLSLPSDTIILSFQIPSFSSFHHITIYRTFDIFRLGIYLDVM